MKTKYCPPQLEIFNIKITNNMLAGSIPVDTANSYDAGSSLGREFDFDDEEEDYQDDSFQGLEHFVSTLGTTCSNRWNK